MGLLNVGLGGIGPILNALVVFEDLITRRVQSTLEAAGEHAYEIADVLVPIDTGYLQSQLDVEKDPGEVRLVNNAEYAVFVELGHHTASGSFVPPQPFMIPALIETGQWLQDEGFKVTMKLPFGKP